MEIKRIDEVNDRIGEFINKEFSDYARQNEVTLNYDEFNFVAEDDDGTILGVITGRTTYNEVHINAIHSSNNFVQKKRRRKQTCCCR